MPTLRVDTRNWVYGDPAGRPLVLVHGFRGDHHGLEGIALRLAELAPGLAIHVPDLPGFGETPPIPGRTHDLALYGEWLAAFFDAVAQGGGSAPGGSAPGGSILGHSFGSLVVSSALAQGLDADRAILINPISSPALDGPQAALTRLAALYYRAADALPEPGARELLGNPVIVRAMSEVMAKTRDPELRGWIHDQHHRYFSRFADPATLLEAFRASVSHTVTEFAEAYTMPTLLIAGERDDITPLAKQLDLAHRIEGAELRVIPGTGHLVHYEAVDDAAALVERFLVSHSTTSVKQSARRGSRAVAGERTK